MAEGYVPSGKIERALREHSSCSQVKGQTIYLVYPRIKKQVAWDYDYASLLAF